jgi:hypothetical protein
MNVTVWGGYVYYNGSYQLVSDTNLTLTPSAINYIHYDYVTNTITADVTDTGTTKSVVVTS